MASALLGFLPVTAERRIEDEPVVIEPLLDIARASEVCVGSAEFRGIWVVRCDAGRNAAAREEPHFDELASPLHGVHTTTVRVEASTIRVSLNSVNIAARCARRAVKSTVVERLCACLTCTIDLELFQ